jgi:hypothetical protein
MNRERARTLTLVLIGLAVLVATAGCSMTTPFGDDSNDDTSDESGLSSETGDESGASNETGDESGSSSETGDESGSGASEGSGSNNSTDERTTTGPIENTGLSVDENRIYNLTRDLLGSDEDAPTITVREVNNRVGRTDRPFFDYMGLTNESEGSASGTGAAAFARGSDSVVVNEKTISRYDKGNIDRFGMILAHEFTHTIQTAEGWSGANLGRTLDPQKTESLALYQSLIEGGAVFTADEYADRVGLNLSQIARFEREYGAAAAELLYAYAPYHHGGQYFDQVLDSGKEVGSVYTDDVPDSTEEVLHPEYGETEPSEVTFSAESNRDGWTRQPNQDDQLGALFVNVVLTAHTEEKIADEASKGWGNDQILGFENGNQSAFAWVTHWDSAQDADQFADGVSGTLSNRSDEDVGDVEVVRAGNQSVVVLAGPEAFRDAIAVDGENANIDIVLQSAADDAVKSQTSSQQTSSRPTIVAG